MSAPLDLQAVEARNIGHDYHTDIVSLVAALREARATIVRLLDHIEGAEPYPVCRCLEDAAAVLAQVVDR